jgi:hypothetical protein
MSNVFSINGCHLTAQMYKKICINVKKKRGFLPQENRMKTRNTLRYFCLRISIVIILFICGFLFRF